MAESHKVVVAVALLVLAARVVSCIQHCNRAEARKDLHSDAGFAPNDVLFAPELELSLSSAIALPSRTPFLPRHIDYHCPSEEKRPPPRAKIPDSTWYLLLVLCGDVEVNPGPVSKFSCRRCGKAVRWNQRGVQCDSCDKWHHTSCINMPASEYLSLSESDVS